MRVTWSSRMTGFVVPLPTPPDDLAQLPLLQEHSLTGQFWLPSAPESRHWGQVHFRPGARVLLVVDDSPWTDSPHAGVEFPVLHGCTRDGAPCTLLDGRGWVDTCYAPDGKRHHRMNVRARQLLVGTHVSGADEPVIAGLVCKFTHLYEWFGPLFETREVGTNPDQVMVTLQAPKFEWKLDWKGTEFTVRPMYSYTAHLQIPPRGTFDYNFGLSIRPATPQSLTWFLSAASMLRWLLIFATGCAVFVTELQPQFPSSEANPVTGYLLQGVDIPSVLQTDVHLFSTRYAEIADVLPELTASWFREAERLRVVIRAYAEALTHGGASEEAVFLGVVQVLEHFHGLIFPERTSYLPRDKWRVFVENLKPEMVRLLPDAGGSEQGNSSQPGEILAGRLGGLNQLSLQSKLQDLIDGMPRPTAAHLLINPTDGEAALGKIAGKVANTRHFLTHYDPEAAHKALAGAGLERVASGCWGMLTYWLARQLGLSQEVGCRMAHQAKYAMFKTSRRSGL